MNRDLAPEQRAFLERVNEFFARPGHGERTDCRFMEANGHPFAEAYRNLMDHYSSLAYAAGFGSRYLAWQGPDEYATLSPPRLTVSVPKQGFAGRYAAYPAMGEEWMRYLAAAAEAGWPHRLKPNIESGTLTVSTRNPALQASLIEATDGAFVEGSHALGSVREAFRLMDIVRRHMGYLPVRTPEQIAAESAPIPLEEKALLRADVDRVSEQDRYVIVPYADRVQDLADPVRVCADLCQLVDRGLPWTTASAYLEQIVDAEGYQALAAHYTAPPEPPRKRFR